MVKEWWQKRIEAERKRLNLQKRKKESWLERTQKNTNLGDFNGKNKE